MNYGLNNFLGNANNTNKTQNSSKVNKISNGLIDTAKAIDGLRNGKTGGERIKNVVMAILSGGASAQK